jgi:hypothetical protein
MIKFAPNLHHQWLCKGTGAATAEATPLEVNRVGS